MIGNTIRIATLADLPRAAEAFAQQLEGLSVVCFWGGMGSGKTTFIKALCAHLGVVDPVTSPTFALINEYLRANGDYIYHFDFYRIRSIQEAWDTGCSEYFGRPGSLCLIEWPQLVEDLLPAARLNVAIRVEADGARTIVLNSKE